MTEPSAPEQLVTSEQPHVPETLGALDSVFEESCNNFWNIFKDLQKKDPAKFNPPTRAGLAEEREGLPWPLNQKDGAFHFRLPGGKNDGLQISWEDEKGTNIVNFGHTTREGKKSVYFERLVGDDITVYEQGSISRYKAETPVEEIPVKKATIEDWTRSEDEATLDRILNEFKKYQETLSPKTSD